jgi:O-antigen/teichoic acid export membrane protein
MNINIYKLDSKSRSKNIILQIATSFFLRGLAIILSLYIVPLTVNYLGKESYGIWVTMLSIVSWISLSDIGIGHGLKNKLAASLAIDEKEKSQSYVSTAYILLFGISILILLISLFIFPYINWKAFFNSPELDIPYLKIMLIFVIYIVVSFCLGIINSILSACQLNSWSNYAPLISSILFIGWLTLFPAYFSNNLLFIVIAYGITNILALAALSVFFFYRFTYLTPNIKHVDKSLIKDIITLGGQFFIIQIAAILIFSTSNILIIQFIGAECVTDYNIAFKLFSVFTLGFSIITGPLWSAYTEAYTKKDFNWIIKSIKTQLLLLIPLVALLVLFVLLFDNILKLWLQDTTKIISISIALIISMAIYVFISIWNNIFAMFLNGISKTKLQITTAIIGGISMIPLSYLFVKVLNWNLTGIVISMSLSLMPFFIFGSLETYKILSIKK